MADHNKKSGRPLGIDTSDKYTTFDGRRNPVAKYRNADETALEEMNRTLRYLKSLENASLKIEEEEPQSSKKQRTGVDPYNTLSK